MNKSYKNSTLTGLSMQYGKQDNIKNKWKEIVKIKDEQLRKKEILKLIKLMERNSINNGFFARKDEIIIRQSPKVSFKIDDTSIYYEFFNNIVKTIETIQQEEKQITDGAIISRSIQTTLKNYFGEYKTGNAKKRLDLLRTICNEDQEKIKSIKSIKQKNCAVCREHSTISHNLWLLCGVQSFCINSDNTEFQNAGGEFIRDGHSFTIVEYDGVYRLFDMDMQNYGPLKGNPIKDLFEGKRLFVEAKKGIQNPGTYGIPNNLLSFM